MIRRLLCALQDHIRVTEEAPSRSPLDLGAQWAAKGNVSDEMYLAITGRPFVTVTRCTRCGWTSRRMDG